MKGRAGRVAFKGYIGERWGRFFVMLDAARLNAEVGDVLSIVLTSTRAAKVVAATRSGAT